MRARNMNTSSLIALLGVVLVGCAATTSRRDDGPISPTRWVIVREDGSVEKGKKTSAGMSNRLTRNATCTGTYWLSRSSHRYREDQYVDGNITRTTMFHPEHGSKTWERLLIDRSNNVWRMTSFYPNGDRKRELERIGPSGKTDRGANHGLYREWYDNGKLKIQCNFKEGKLHGRFSCYRNDGVSIFVGVYRNGEPWDGRLPEDFIKSERMVPSDGRIIDAKPWNGISPADLSEAHLPAAVRYRNGELVDTGD